MEIVELILKIGEIGEFLWKPVGHRLGYMVHYKRNIRSLMEQIEKLEAKRNDHQLSIDAALNDDYEIKSEVQLWLQKVGEAITEAGKLQNEAQVDKKCFSVLCPDFRWRYRLGKKAVMDMEKIRALETEGSFERVYIDARRAPKFDSMITNEDFELFGSTGQAMDAVMQALKDDKVTIIGVYGMGGIGKTMMVNQVGLQAQNEGLFDHVIPVVVSQKPNIEKIQRHIAEMLAMKLHEDSSDIIRSRLKERIMRGKKMLIILDDVWRGIDLSKDIGIPSRSQLEECRTKILLTTRLENVCQDMDCQAKIPLEVLSDQDSWDLFRKRAGKLVESTDFYAEGRKIARECGGLPIALVTVARALGDKDLEEWKEAAQRLETSRPINLDDNETVFKCIKLSYDYLKRKDAQPCFLICCLFPEDYNILVEDLVKYGIGQGLFQDANSMEEARREAHSVIKRLKACSLLLDSEQEGCVKMHDVIRDNAILIPSSVNGNAFLVQAGIALKTWPQKHTYEGYTAISLMWNEIDRLPEELACRRLETLLLQNNSEIREMPDTFFQSLNSLKVLDLSGTDISTLPPSLKNLSNLRTLNLDRCQSITDITILGELKKLEILSLRESYLEELPKEIGQLVNLRMLDITMSYNIKTIPSNEISRLSRLEELYMQGSFGDWGHEVEEPGEGSNTSFDELTRLPYLSILKVDISDAECMPKDVSFSPNWVKFDICISRNTFARFMNVHLSKAIALHSRALVLDTAINTLPDWFNKVVTEKVEKLLYIECRGLDNILVEYEHGRLNGLKSLLIQQCYQIVNLMNTVTWVPRKLVFERLEELCVHNMDSLQELCVGQLPDGSLGNLEFLEVQQCNDMVNALLESNLLRRLENLQILSVSGTCVQEIFRSEGHEQDQIALRKLRELKLDNLLELTNIWNGPARLAVFSNLKILAVTKCKKLRILFPRAISQCLLQLEELWVEDCHGLEGIIGTHEGHVTDGMATQSTSMEIVEKHEEAAMNKIIFPQMKNLSLQSLPQLTSFYSGSANISVECSSLEHLYVQDCPMLRISNPDFGSKKQVQVNNEQHMSLLRKRLWELRQSSSR